MLHVDLDAFFAAVEQRDKPRCAVGRSSSAGSGGRGVVATASYEARAFGARSAMSTAEARRRCPPGTAYLGGRFAAYRRTSDVVMELLRELSRWSSRCRSTRPTWTWPPARATTCRWSG